MEPDSDYIHTSDSTINQNSGSNVGRSLDVRAIKRIGRHTNSFPGLKADGYFYEQEILVLLNLGEGECPI